jgi:Protein of unknown function (DUF3500)
MKKKLIIALVTVGLVGAGFAGYKVFGTGGDRARLTDAEIEAEPFVGVTTDGKVAQNLFPLKVTGVSTAALQNTAAAFIASLTAEQKKATLFDVEALEWRKWSNVDDYTRAGTNLVSMTEAQRTAAWAMIDAFLSDQGMTEIRNAMKLNYTEGELLKQTERFNENLYWVTIMGTPDPVKPWGFQIDGHHVAINFFVLGDQLSITPAFMGAEPPVAPKGTKYAGLGAFQAKQDMGLAFAQTLTAAQLKTAVLSPDKTKDDMIASAFGDNAKIPETGLLVSDMTPLQKTAFMNLIKLWADDMEAGHAAVWLADIFQHLDKTRFAWIGKTDAKAVFYYRIYSPVILIEFDHELPKPLANVEGYASDIPTRNHIHAIVRTPNGNDYGKDWLRQHLLTSH